VSGPRITLTTTEPRITLTTTEPRITLTTIVACAAAWVSPCQPNSEVQHLDETCDRITKCTAAGTFGLFLKAVTGGCKSKSFDGYYGLDGLTYGEQLIGATA
jgi:hypothetical protein